MLNVGIRNAREEEKEGREAGNEPAKAAAACCLQQPHSPQPKFAEGEFGLW